MKTIDTLSVVVALTLLAFALPTLGGQNQPFTISITPVSSEVKLGAEVKLKITLKNLSQKEIIGTSGYRVRGLDQGYKYDCRNASGNLVTKEVGADGSIHEPIVLKSGEDHSETIPLSRACDLTQPGVYTVQLSRSDPSDPQHQDIKSNIVAITMAP